MPILQFDEKHHKYSVGGTYVPGVTSALKAITANDYFGVDKEVMRKKAEFGKAVHRIIELDCKNTLMPEDLSDDALIPYFMAWADFRRKSGFRVIQSEGQYHSERYGYAGTLDLFGVLNGIYSIIDAKCVVKVMRSTGPQTAAYENLVREANPNLFPGAETPIRRYALQLRPAPEGSDTARWHLVPLTDKQDFKVFLASLAITSWNERTKP